MSTSRKHEDFTAENFGRFLKEKQHAYKQHAWDVRTSDESQEDEEESYYCGICGKLVPLGRGLHPHN